VSGNTWLYQYSGLPNQNWTETSILTELIRETRAQNSVNWATGLEFDQLKQAVDQMVNGLIQVKKK
jgi:hypothetical protein